MLTVSDGVSEGTREDRSGDLLEELLEGFEVIRRVVPDEQGAIADAILELAGEAELVLTTGGTGLGPRDVTPEATMQVLDRARARDRRGDPRRLDREDAARPALAWDRGCLRLDAGRQPARLARAASATGSRCSSRRWSTRCSCSPATRSPATARHES